jgi:hypothetical protein
MTPQPHKHEHTSTTYAIRQRSGIPFQVERKVCADCKRVLDEKPLRRAAA